MKQEAGFDNVAWIYDFLASIVFGNALRKAQYHYLNEIRDQDKVLIIGGGTGHILKAIEQRSIQCSIDYVEASEKMLQKAMKRKHNLSVNFIHGIEQTIVEKEYDVIITAFFLDCFKEERLVKVIEKLGATLVKGGKWLLTDFSLSENAHFLKKGLVKVMYLFFKVSCGLEANKLLDFTACFKKNFQVLKSTTFYHQMLFSTVYKKK